MKKLLIMLLMSGCMVGPNYQKPDSAVQEEWNAEPTANAEAPKDKWWEEFSDPLLNQYIEIAAEYNYDIQAAEKSILKARALRQIAASKLFPQVTADVNATKTYFSKNGPIFAIGQAAGNPTDTTSATTGLPFTIQVPQIQNLYNALFDASWEIDFFGKTRRSVESAMAEYESLIEQKNAMMLSVFAEVVRNYIDLRSFQRKADLLEDQILIYEKHQEIIQASYRCGYVNLLDLETIQAELASARALLPSAYAEIYRAMYTLSVLIGKPPEALVEELLVRKELPKGPEVVAVGLPSDLLRRRPDVRYQERKLAQATADVGVSVAAFFPSFSLMGGGGLQSLSLPNLFEWGSRTWAFGADVNMPIFKGGNLVGNLRFSQAEKAVNAAKYQQVVLSALQDAESSLKKYEEAKRTAYQYNQNVLHNEKVVTLTRERYLKGLINLIDVLNNEKQLIGAQITELDSKTLELLSLVSLYKSLGGGWQSESEETE